MPCSSVTTERNVHNVTFLSLMPKKILFGKRPRPIHFRYVFFPRRRTVVILTEKQNFCELAMVSAQWPFFYIKLLPYIYRDRV
jgi:hypothetical protein